ncbi:MAG: methionine--tRNA ligase [Pseudomonadota bacterium]
MTKRSILVTCALPYANGHIHLGHLLEHIQADIWVRFQKMRDHEIYFISGDDCHGTPVMLRAEKEGVTPEALVEKMRLAHKADFDAFLIDYDHYSSTHTEEGKTLVQAIYCKLRDKGDIEVKTIQQAFDTVKQMFLPDRFIKGTCPKCNTADQYGDNCEHCGATYDPTELKNPLSVLSGTVPVEKESDHYFFKLKNYESFLREWTQSGRLQSQVTNKLNEWFTSGLNNWDISRDAPYFGFEIPDVPGKYFYVWLDAPMGYLAIFQELCNKNNIDFNSFWGKESRAEIHHFIGKDIIYFHALFWPAILEGAGYRTPSSIFAHSFLTVDKQKMSKSRGTFIQASTFVQHVNPEYLRYYFAAKLSSKIEDIDLNLEDFIFRINSDLVGKFVNLASRSAGFIHKKFNGMLAENFGNNNLYQEFIAQSNSIAEHYENRDYHNAIREIMALADKANQFVDENKPWQLAKEEGKETQTHQVCSLAINLFYVLMIYLKPVLPETARKVEAFLNCAPLTWQSLQTPLINHEIAEFKPLLTRIEQKHIDEMLEQTKRDLSA